MLPYKTEATATHKWRKKKEVNLFFLELKVSLKNSVYFSTGEVLTSFGETCSIGMLIGLRKQLNWTSNPDAWAGVNALNEMDLMRVIQDVIHLNQPQSISK
ncbi:hypothetical protein NPIL_187271 [Nephila pilipes]|uniref:Uncharacterized protein n=1 Tax=Nephila pilipes TaxID=299642 RepID=A0A8X6TFP2_NEPPI|nr:hypothetical protein NPIL_187271 [Nephila pilipes]